MNKPSSYSSHPTPAWRFWIPLLFQTALILTVPAQAVYIQLTGRTVILQTVPADPYDLLRGYSQTLRFDISSQNRLRNLPGWRELPKQAPDGNDLTLVQPGTRFYVILQAPATPSTKQLPRPWKAVAVSLEYPFQLPANQVAIKGLAKYSFVQYGLETYYIPEDQREEINQDLREASQDSPPQPQPTISPANPSQPQIRQTPPIVMEIKVNAKGESVPISLWARVGGDSNQPQIRNYRF